MCVCVCVCGVCVCVHVCMCTLSVAPAHSPHLHEFSSPGGLFHLPENDIVVQAALLTGLMKRTAPLSPQTGDEWDPNQPAVSRGPSLLLVMG